jgi:regulator of protease activity HflC (stomatin/prohibitin superfamily)
MCVSCRRFDQQLALLRQAIRSLRRRAEAEAQDAKLTPEAQDRIRRALAEGRGQPRD